MFTGVVELDGLCLRLHILVEELMRGVCGAVDEVSKSVKSDGSMTCVEVRQKYCHL